MKITKRKLRQIIREAILVEMQTITAYHGTSSQFSKFDPEATTEFGIHFAVTPESARHRDSTRLIEVQLTYSNPIYMPDLMRWNLMNIARELRLTREEVVEMRKRAASLARADGRSMRVHENNAIGDKLDELGYDAIIYDNRGEAGGEAIIIWHRSQIKNLGDI